MTTFPVSFTLKDARCTGVDPLSVIVTLTVMKTGAENPEPSSDFAATGTETSKLTLVRVSPETCSGFIQKPPSEARISVIVTFGLKMFSVIYKILPYGMTLSTVKLVVTRDVGLLVRDVSTLTFGLDDLNP